MSMQDVFVIVARFLDDELSDSYWEWFEEKDEAEQRLTEMSNLSEFEGYTLLFFEASISESDWNNADYGYDLGDYLDMEFDNVFDVNRPSKIINVPWF